MLAILHDKADVDLIVIGAASALLFILVVARMAGLVRANERAVAREQILSSAGSALVAATDREQAARITLEAAADLVGPRARVRLATVEEGSETSEGVLRLPLDVRGENRGALEVEASEPLSAAVLDCARRRWSPWSRWRSRAPTSRTRSRRVAARPASRPWFGTRAT